MNTDTDTNTGGDTAQTVIDDIDEANEMLGAAIDALQGAIVSLGEAAA